MSATAGEMIDGFVAEPTRGIWCSEASDEVKIDRRAATVSSGCSWYSDAHTSHASIRMRPQASISEESMPTRVGRNAATNAIMAGVASGAPAAVTCCFVAPGPERKASRRARSCPTAINLRSRRKAALSASHSWPCRRDISSVKRWDGCVA